MCELEITNRIRLGGDLHNRGGPQCGRVRAAGRRQVGRQARGTTREKEGGACLSALDKIREA